MKMTVRTMTGILLAGLFLLVSAAGNSQAAVETGAAAPDFTLSDADNMTKSLSDYAGKYVVLEWLNHECPFVRKHYDSNNMQGLQEEFTQKGVVWLSIISSAPGKQGHCTAEEASELKEQKAAHPTAVLLDSDGTVGKLYGAKTTPHMFIVDPDGTLIYQGAIDDVPSADPADIAEATNYVRLALSQSMAGEEVSNPSTKSYGCSVKY